MLFRSPQLLTNDLKLSMLTSTDQKIGDATGQIRFDPDGGSSGGRVAIAGGDKTWWVGVDWLTGRVTLAEKAPQK